MCVLVGVRVGTRVEVGVCVGDGTIGVCVGVGEAVGVLVATGIIGIGVAVSSEARSSFSRRAGLLSSFMPELTQPMNATSSVRDNSESDTLINMHLSNFLLDK